MKLVILGAGAIGAYVGAAVSRGGGDVTLVARGEHLSAMQRDGVRVLSPRGDFYAHPEATDDLAAVAGADAVFLGLKAYSLPKIAPMLAESIRPGTPVIAAQNGIPWWYFHREGGPLDGITLESVDPGGGVSDALSPEDVIGCVVYAATEVVAPGVVRHIEGTRFSIGQPDGGRGRCTDISRLFSAGGLKCPVDQALRNQIWLKLVGNAAFNSCSVLTRGTLRQLGALQAMKDLLRTLLEEGAAIADALGVSLPLSIDRRLTAAIDVGDHKTSMLQDCEASKQLEVDCMTGAMIEIADRLGVAVPTLRTIDALMRAAGYVSSSGGGRAAGLDTRVAAE
jgi:2-dehydropantoate 2-reductase